MADTSPALPTPSYPATTGSDMAPGTFQMPGGPVQQMAQAAGVAPQPPAQPATDLLDRAVARAPARDPDSGAGARTMLRPAPTPTLPSKFKGIDKSGPVPKLTGGEYEPYIESAAQEWALPTELVRGMAWVESHFNPKAIGPQTSGGWSAKGMMQLGPKVIKAYGVLRPLDVAGNLMGGAHYIRDMIDRYNGSVPLALAAYNWGPEKVDKVGGDFSKMPADVRKYVKDIMGWMGSGGTDPAKTDSDPSGASAAEKDLRSAYAAWQKDKNPATTKAFIDAKNAYQEARASAADPGRVSTTTTPPLAPWPALPGTIQGMIQGGALEKGMTDAQRNKFLLQIYPGSRIMDDKRPGAAEKQFLLLAGGQKFSLIPKQDAPGKMLSTLAGAGAMTAGAYVVGELVEPLGGGPALAGGINLAGKMITSGGRVAGAMAGGVGEHMGEQALKGRPLTEGALETAGGAAAAELGGQAIAGTAKYLRPWVSKFRDWIWDVTPEIGAKVRGLVARGAYPPFETALPGATHFNWATRTARQLVGEDNVAVKANIAVVNKDLDALAQRVGLEESARADLTGRILEGGQFDTAALGKDIQDSLPAIPTKVGVKEVRKGKGVIATKEEITKGEQEIKRTSVQERTKKKTTTVSKEDVTPPERAQTLYNRLRGMSPENVVTTLLRKGQADDLKILWDNVLSDATKQQIQHTAFVDAMMGTLPKQLAKTAKGTKLGMRKDLEAYLYGTAKRGSGYTPDQIKMLFPNGLDKDMVQTAGILDDLFPGVEKSVGNVSLHAGAIQAMNWRQRVLAMAKIGAYRWLITRPKFVAMLADGARGGPLSNKAAHNTMQGALNYFTQAGIQAANEELARDRERESRKRDLRLGAGP